MTNPVNQLDREMIWALGLLAEELPERFKINTYQFETRLGGVQLNIPLASVSISPAPILMEMLTQEAEANGRHYVCQWPALGQPSQDYHVQYDGRTFAQHQLLLVAMIMARVGVYRVPQLL